MVRGEGMERDSRVKRFQRVKRRRRKVGRETLGKEMAWSVFQGARRDGREFEGQAWG